jgi:hypothetical protein|tara:strand:- start:144 stop:752 length:609 start_codon:yes stop_codon:yes gene_type:complete
MQTIRGSVIKAFNEYITELKQGKGKENISVSLTTFSTNVDQSMKYDNTPLSQVKEMTTEDYVPGGMTALYDGIGLANERIEERLSKKRAETGVMFVIITDGFENNSQDYDIEKIQKLIKEKEGDGTYSFVYLAAHEKAFLVGKDLGIHARNTAFFAASDEGVKNSMQDLGEATMCFSSCVSSRGAASSSSNRAFATEGKRFE